jgi:hypothetical protein
VLLKQLIFSLIVQVQLIEKSIVCEQLIVLNSNSAVLKSNSAAQLVKIMLFKTKLCHLPLEIMLLKTKLCHSLINYAVIMLALPLNFSECKLCYYYAGQIDVLPT